MDSSATITSNAAQERKNERMATLLSQSVSPAALAEMRLSQREICAVERFQLFESTLIASGHTHDRYTGTDHALWEAAAIALYGKGYEADPHFDNARVAEREALLRALALGF